MRMITVAPVLILASMVAGTASAQVPSASAASAHTQPMTHEAFMAIETSKRSDVFAKLTPENKSALKRAHANAWLTKNKYRLSTKQTAAVQEAIAFLSPDLYREPGSPAMRTKEDQVRRQLECTLSRNDVIAAFTFLAPSSAPTLSEQVDEWLIWFDDCVVGVGG
jgi:hypothetical protein